MKRALFVLIALVAMLAVLPSAVGAQESECVQIGNMEFCGAAKDVAAVELFMLDGTEPAEPVTVYVSAAQAEVAAEVGPIFDALPAANALAQDGQGGGGEDPAFPFDLFSASDNDCFAIADDDVDTAFGPMHRVLEYTHGLRKVGDVLEAYEPATRGEDPNTWGPWVILSNVAASRDMECGEVQAHHPTLYSGDLGEEPAYVRFQFSLDTGHDAFADAYNTAAEGAQNDLGWFLGSTQGVDVRVNVYDNTGALTATGDYRVEGEYCSDCPFITETPDGNAEFEFQADDFAFEEGTRKVRTEDILVRRIPRDFDGMVEILVYAEDGEDFELWFGTANEAVDVGQGGAEAGANVVTLADAANVRTEPNSDSQMLATLPAGAQVQLVAFPNVPGWVFIDAQHPTRPEWRVSGFITRERAGNPKANLPEWTTWQAGVYDPTSAG